MGKADQGKGKGRVVVRPDALQELREGGAAGVKVRVELVEHQAFLAGKVSAQGEAKKDRDQDDRIPTEQG